VIARYQTILFAVLVAASVAMGGVLWHLRERAHQRLLKGEDSAPTRAPAVAPAEQATLLVANDADNSMIEETQSLPLPQDAGSRARVILGKLLDIYAAPDATHAVPGGASSVAQVFLLPAPSLNAGLGGASSAQTRPPPLNGPELAVVNFTGGFAAGHPSGLEAENLTVESICGTLHANLPRVTQVRFLVDGQTRATLAGHADLTRTYLATEAAPTAGAH
jgi:Sporulation and spore germination